MGSAKRFFSLPVFGFILDYFFMEILGILKTRFIGWQNELLIGYLKGLNINKGCKVWGR